MVTLNPDAMDVLEANPTEWVLEVEGNWSRRGLLHPSTPRWYFQRAGTPGSWSFITRLPYEETRRTGTGRWSLEPSSLRPDDADPVTTGELVHISCVPQVVQLWVAGFRPAPGECDGLEEAGGGQQSLAGWLE